MKKKLFTVLEILIWTVLFFIPVFFLVTLLHPDLSVQKHYYVDFKDINGVILGSPVNFIGYTIGHVQKIDILEDRIRVDMAIIEKNYSLPRCSVVKIEESGLGGSRSLEIFPCPNPNMPDGIYGQSPKRVNELLEDACSFVESLVQGMGNLMIALQVSIGDGKDYATIHQKIIDSKNNFDKMGKELDTIKVKSQQNLTKTKERLGNMLSVISTIKINPAEIKTNCIQTQKQLDNINTNLNKYSAADYRKKAEQMYLITESMQIIDKDKAHEKMLKLNSILNASEKFFQCIEEEMKSEKITNSREKINCIKNKSKKLIEED